MKCIRASTCICSHRIGVIRVVACGAVCLPPCGGGYPGHRRSDSQAIPVLTRGVWDCTPGMVVGNAGTGGLAISGGSIVTVGRHCYVGREPTGVGTITIRDANSRFRVDEWLHVGYDGQGTLSVSQGATLSASSTYIAERGTATSSLVVTGPGTVFSTGGLNVGAGSRGLARIEEGAQAMYAGIYLGEHSPGSGVLVVTGGSSLSGGRLTVGEYGHGELQVQAPAGEERRRRGWQLRIRDRNCHALRRRDILDDVQLPERRLRRRRHRQRDRRCEARQSWGYGQRVL